LAAARSGRPLVLDAGTWRPVFADLLPHATVAACSAAFRPPGDLPVDEALRALGADSGAITHGPDPVRWWSGDDAGELEVPRVPAVDTAGAGDAFHGALTVAVAQGAELTEALRYAIGIAGIRVQHRGPRSWLAALR
jgi:sugar/nucleoside kinase (ribokinase family)